MRDQTIPDKWFYPIILILGIYFIVRLINQSQMVSMFPLDFVNDYSSHIAELFFLQECGFHNFCPYWYNGFILFISYVPGWFFFTYPIYLLTGDPLLSTFISLLILFVLIFALLFVIGKKHYLSSPKIVAFFLLLFANPISIGNFIRLGRMTELFGWFVFFMLAVVIYYYRNKEFDRWFLIFIPLYAILMISHLNVMLIAQLFVLSLFLVKPVKEKIYLVLASLAGLGLASFWVVPYLLDLRTNTTLGYAFGRWFLDFRPDQLLTNITTFFVSAFLWFSFYYYWKQKHFSKKILLFYSPVLVMSFLSTFRISPYLPIMKHLYPDPLMFFYLFFAFLFFLKLKMRVIPDLVKKILPLALLLIPILFVAVSSWYTPWFVEHGPVEEEVLDMLHYVEGRFVTSPSPYQSSYGRAYYSYAPIYHNLSSADGWAGIYMTNEYKEVMDANVQAFRSRDCSTLRTTFSYLDVDDVIGYDQYCELMTTCGFEQVRKLEHVCLFRIT